MSNKHKGSNAERELLKKFTEHGWRAARVAGSGVNDDSPCDLIAGKARKGKYAIEAKTTKKNIQYISKAQMEDFVMFSTLMGLKPVIALRFIREGWLFVNPKKLRSTGKNWAISLNDARKNGKKFAQFFR